ncbi:MAG: S-layer homology domain-containing protein [Epulopiscium sp.]|nr:S-layer homology domain-containing protein [Candidatus Epulonipiscium sp.]
MAVMIHRALLATEKIQENKSYSALEKYQDDSHIADYAKESVSVLTGEGMIQGDQNHSFHPTRYAKRAEAARVLLRIL